MWGRGQRPGATSNPGGAGGLGGPSVHRESTAHDFARFKRSRLHYRQWSRTYSSISSPGSARVLLFMRTQKTSSCRSLRRHGHRRLRDVHSAYLYTVDFSIRVRVRITAVCGSAAMRCVVSQFTRPSTLGGLTTAESWARPIGCAVVDADEQRAAIGVEETGDRLDDRVLHPLVLALLPRFHGRLT